MERRYASGAVATIMYDAAGNVFVPENHGPLNAEVATFDYIYDRASRLLGEYR